VRASPHSIGMEHHTTQLSHHSTPACAHEHSSRIHPSPPCPAQRTHAIGARGGAQHSILDMQGFVVFSIPIRLTFITTS
jgi:hypothetical protein